MVTWDTRTLPNAMGKADVWIRIGFRLVLRVRVQAEFSLTIHFSGSIFKLTEGYAA